MLQQLKYLSAYMVPLLVGFGFYAKGAWSYTCLLFLFGLVPLLELFLSPKTENLDESRELQTEKSFFFDLLLYLNLPLLYIFLGWYLYILHTYPLSLWEFIGLAVNMGLAGGIMGINVAHELGHRTNWYEQWMSKMLLLPNLYTHFFIEHNRGHHVHIATDEDPASARLNEPVYKFYARSVIGGFLSACRLEQKKMALLGLSFWHFKNELLRYQFFQLIYLCILAYVGGILGLLGGIFAAFVGILLLETVNYIEHYGLRRQKTDSGRYERVQPCHSWNADYPLGRILLYELTRHSDHHYKASRKYQVLRHLDESPNLPFGYPAAMLLSLCPPFWFRIMNPHLNQYTHQRLEKNMNNNF